MTAITSEIERFNRLSATWWNSQGPMRPLHVVNALRLGHVVDQIAQHRGRPAADALKGLRMLDVGCGGGLLSEPLARLGAQVVGVDASPGNVAAARLHAQSEGVAVDYRLGEPAQVLAPGEQFDVVLALEVVEHVSDVPDFLDTVARRVAPGGLLIASTIDRTWKSFAFAIVGAEYVLRVLPRGTHQWSRFVRPTELAASVARAGLQQRDLRGMRYLPLLHRASWCRDTRVNYIATYAHAPATGVAARAT
ncbi:bifunctional 2-polyprenyl-6-hydroxyphenol methylase/3-demethylubiquinol 3-O-methyltransferase UbiG [Hydrogenophaga sp.]|uniref:bifunctional 2-polyprenyl-6-hydroxyphenol methylase/3-demethylubiquinol 3-O-methyltransferase UbiG n=1 Tax=Hydrogenophaga sp. TaxID=1904254 RepID=UPI002622A6FB|nr:bifunctional 2-polyprenyl-6-hydroxyphenol methylase/3-demethylubiquinol 3-O-methyltransferase UbiG [Hydrogenophaga sp.]